jgi:hypothetical protein
LVLNQTLAIRGVTNTGQDDFVLDKAFALIEGFWETEDESLSGSERVRAWRVPFNDRAGEPKNS